MLLPTANMEVHEQMNSTKALVVTQNYQALQRREVDESFDEVNKKMALLGSICNSIGSTSNDRTYFANY
jgi:hypothetical protein